MIRRLRLFLIGCPVCGRWRTRHFAFCPLDELVAGLPDRERY